MCGCFAILSHSSHQLSGGSPWYWNTTRCLYFEDFVDLLHSRRIKLPSISAPGLYSHSRLRIGLHPVDSSYFFTIICGNGEAQLCVYTFKPIALVLAQDVTAQERSRQRTYDHGVTIYWNGNLQYCTSVKHGEIEFLWNIKFPIVIHFILEVHPPPFLYLKKRHIFLDFS